MGLSLDRSAAIFEKARRLIPGGVNSPVRAFGAVGGTPPVIAGGKGACVWDEDGNRYIDYLASWGPLILGHADDDVARALRETLERGWTFGAPTKAELSLAETVTHAFPSIEMLRLVSSGTEAAMSAIRLARAFTGRQRIVKFVGCYHGHADYLLVRAGSGGATFGTPTSPGIPTDVARNTLPVAFNRLDAVQELMTRHGEQVAAIIVEPVAGNMGVVPCAPGFLQGLRDLATRHGAVLIFDEVITGFRVCLGGAQALYGVTPDMTVLGKILGGGLPIGAFGGRREIMERLAPAGPVYQAGTLSGNPLSVAAGLATLAKLQSGKVYERIDRLAEQLESGLLEAAARAGVPVTINRVGSMMSLFFADGPVTDYETAARGPDERFARFFWGMLTRGVYLPPSRFETFFVSAAHGPGEIARAVEAAKASLGELATR